jgi:hypothetical protein
MDDQAEIQLDAFDRYRSKRVPLAAANFVLSLALVGGASRTMARRPGAIAWLQQLCAASALYAVVEGVVSAPETAYVAARFEAVQHGAPPGLYARAWRLRALVAAVAEVLLYGGLALSLSSGAVAQELAPPDPSARPARRDEDDDDDDDGGDFG